jgi:hypothetical protein
MSVSRSLRRLLMWCRPSPEARRHSVYVYSSARPIRFVSSQVPRAFGV